MQRRWDSLHPETLFGDAAARVLCRIAQVEPSGRTLQQCLDRVPVPANDWAEMENARHGDGGGLECKASLKSANVCISDFELSHTRALVLAAWVPATDELFWFADMEEVRKPSARFWLSAEQTWLVCRDSIEVL